ncbi:hypothetical protein NST17_20765 [Caldifermentibacillus hisashii]|uniref:Uncharacterized protein n=1 Tax=Caldifermentibacillus hisashii TaxID=996558 RepID=A0ABU9K3B3_9BACI|nr:MULTISPECIES: hypothetical protein [Bacillaceae]MCB5936747.1 hypothetical protein [Bacillus sp. DFI.2.34]MCB7078282.1 hypothetical protein [Caldibacillus thermoamylovorans]MED4852229.1 hypothetical protein [Caldifermentibacillus hisashii]
MKIDTSIKYYVFQAELTDLDGSPTGESFKFCCSNVRWATLKLEIEESWLVVKSSVKKLFETTDRNEARRLSDYHEY